MSEILRPPPPSPTPPPQKIWANLIGTRHFLWCSSVHLPIIAYIHAKTCAHILVSVLFPFIQGLDVKHSESVPRPPFRHPVIPRDVMPAEREHVCTSQPRCLYHLSLTTHLQSVTRKASRAGSAWTRVKRLQWQICSANALYWQWREQYMISDGLILKA